MLTGHASHQVGLDADIWLTPMPDRQLSRNEREETSAVMMVRADRLDIDPAAWKPGHLEVVKAAAQETLDARGQVLLPGLVDAHVHYSQTGWADGRPDALDLRGEHRYEAAVARLRELDRNRPQLEADLRALNAAIPATPDLGTFILSANEIAAAIDALQTSGDGFGRVVAVFSAAA